MSINEKALADVTILKYNNTQSLNDFKDGHVDILDKHHSKFDFPLANPILFSPCMLVVVQLLRTLFATALQSNRIIKLRMSLNHQKLNSILLF